MTADPPMTATLFSWADAQPERHARALKRQAPPTELEEATGRAGKDALMPRARQYAASGICTGWPNVLATMEMHGLDTALLRIWASATDRDEIDRMCARIRASLPKHRR